jgi:hypothetical protein
MRFEHQSLRQGLVFAACPSLGASGLSLIDRSERNRHGTLVNMEGQDNWPASGSGRALRFDGSNDHATFTPPSISLSSITLSGWANYISTPSAYSPLVYVRQGSFVSGVLRSGGAAQITSQWTGTASEYNAVTGLSVPAVGVWFFWAMVVSESTVTTWLNLQSFSVAITPTAYNIGVQWSLARDSFGPRLSNVLLDDVRIYSRAITQAELSLLASRRGIGLQPLPDRAAGLPRKLFVNDAGTWRDGDAYVNTGSEWRLGIPSVNDAGTWR